MKLGYLNHCSSVTAALGIKQLVDNQLHHLFVVLVNQLVHTVQHKLCQIVDVRSNDMRKRQACLEWVQPVIAFEMRVRPPHEELDVDNHRLMELKTGRLGIPSLILALKAVMSLLLGL